MRRAPIPYITSLTALAVLAFALLGDGSAGARVTLHEGPVTVVFSPPDFTADTDAGPSTICPDRIRGRVGNPAGPVTLYRPDLTKFPPKTGPSRRPTDGKLAYPPVDGEEQEAIPVVMTIPLGPIEGAPTQQDPAPYWGGYFVTRSAPFEAQLPASVTPGETLWLLPFGTIPHVVTVIPCTPPTATGQSLSTAFETAVPVTLGGTDAEGDPLTFAVATPPSHGSLTGTAPNLTYTPASGYSGPDSFTFTTGDGQYTSAPATVSIEVGPAPVATDRVTVTVSGAFTYAASGAFSRPLDVRRSGGIVTDLTGSGRIDGTDPRAGLRVDAHRLLFSTIGAITVHDPAAGIAQLGALVVSATPMPASGPITLTGIGIRVQGFRLLTYRITVSIDPHD